MARLAVVAWLAASVAFAQPTSGPLELRIEGPAHLQPVVDQIRRLDASRFDAILRLTGASTAGAPIRVVLVPEDSRIARDAAPWIAAFADSRNDLIVLFPERIGSYPYDSLEVVLHHEVAHILAGRAAGGGLLPRWFNEGLASTAERTWGVGSRSRFLLANLTTGEPTIAELEGLFGVGGTESARAYAISHALVRDLLRRYGVSLVPRILDRVAAGATFDQAFYEATGTTVRNAARIFWRSAGGWEEWITFVASPYTQWTVITSLALVAIWRHRRRRAARRRQWEEDERLETEEWEEHRRRYRLH